MEDDLVDVGVRPQELLASVETSQTDELAVVFIMYYDTITSFINSSSSSSSSRRCWASCSSPPSSTRPRAASPCRVSSPWSSRPEPPKLGSLRLSPAPKSLDEFREVDTSEIVQGLAPAPPSQPIPLNLPGGKGVGASSGGSPLLQAAACSLSPWLTAARGNLGIDSQPRYTYIYIYIYIYIS